jgi:hypothetical protein
VEVVFDSLEVVLRAARRGREEGGRSGMVVFAFFVTDSIARSLLGEEGLTRESDVVD